MNNDILFESIKLAGEAAQEAYRQGQTEGYGRGFKAGIEEAQRIINATLGHPDMLSRPSQPTPASIQDDPKSALVENLP